MEHFSEKRERILFLLFVFIFIFILLIYRLYNIQVVGGSVLHELARKEHNRPHICHRWQKEVDSMIVI